MTDRTAGHDCSLAKMSSNYLGILPAPKIARPRVVLDILFIVKSGKMIVVENDLKMMGITR
ncbi:hypothetical protein [Haladaptatus sp. CMAA 1911]|uniref:hypothetical protein n=1 Tax=unclassified Haladaptatus TaxID=2622732 RepID=UPI003754D6A9